MRLLANEKKEAFRRYYAGLSILCIIADGGYDGYLYAHFLHQFKDGLLFRIG